MQQTALSEACALVKNHMAWAFGTSGSFSLAPNDSPLGASCHYVTERQSKKTVAILSLIRQD